MTVDSQGKKRDKRATGAAGSANRTMPDANGVKEFGRLKTAAAARLIPAPPRLSDDPKIKKMFPSVEKYDEDMKKFVQEGIGKTVNE